MSKRSEKDRKSSELSSSSAPNVSPAASSSKEKKTTKLFSKAKSWFGSRKERNEQQRKAVDQARQEMLKRMEVGNPPIQEPPKKRSDPKEELEEPRKELKEPRKSHEQKLEPAIHHPKEKPSPHLSPPPSPAAKASYPSGRMKRLLEKRKSSHEMVQSLRVTVDREDKKRKQREEFDKRKKEMLARIARKHGAGKKKDAEPSLDKSQSSDLMYPFEVKPIRRSPAKKPPSRSKDMEEDQMDDTQNSYSLQALLDYALNREGNETSVSTDDDEADRKPIQWDRWAPLHVLEGRDRLFTSGAVQANSAVSAGATMRKPGEKGPGTLLRPYSPRHRASIVKNVKVIENMKGQAPIRYTRRVNKKDNMPCRM